MNQPNLKGVVFWERERWMLSFKILALYHTFALLRVLFKIYFCHHYLTYCSIIVLNIKLVALFINKKIFSALFWIDLFHSSLQKDLGPDVCQAIWNAAGSNLKVPLELKVDLTIGTKNVFTPEPAGKIKIASSQVFTTFKGNSGPCQHNNLRELR